jgi:hypothetical protein
MTKIPIVGFVLAVGSDFFLHRGVPWLDLLDPNESTAKKVCTKPLFGSDWPRYII